MSLYLDHEPCGQQCDDHVSTFLCCRSWSPGVTLVCRKIKTKGQTGFTFRLLQYFWYFLHCHTEYTEKYLQIRQKRWEQTKREERHIHKPPDEPMMGFPAPTDVENDLGVVDKLELQLQWSSFAQVSLNIMNKVLVFNSIIQGFLILLHLCGLHSAKSKKKTKSFLTSCVTFRCDGKSHWCKISQIIVQNMFHSGDPVGASQKVHLNTLLHHLIHLLLYDCLPLYVGPWAPSLRASAVSDLLLGRSLKSLVINHIVFSFIEHITVF